jgi:Mg2+/Co2+ transporter CorB
LNDVPLGTLFSVLGLLLVLSAFFSGTETALMSINRYRLRHRANRATAARGSRGAAGAARPLIGLILLGNNFVNILASSLATVIAIKLGGEGAIAIAPAS